MKRLDRFELDAADVQRIDAIVRRQGGKGIAEEAAEFGRQRVRRLSVLAALLALVALAVLGAWSGRVPWG